MSGNASVDCNERWSLGAQACDIMHVGGGCLLCGTWTSCTHGAVNQEKLVRVFAVQLPSSARVPPPFDPCPPPLSTLVYQRGQVR